MSKVGLIVIIGVIQRETQRYFLVQRNTLTGVYLRMGTCRVHKQPSCEKTGDRQPSAIGYTKRMLGTSVRFPAQVTSLGLLLNSSHT